VGSVCVVFARVKGRHGLPGLYGPAPKAEVGAHVERPTPAAELQTGRTFAGRRTAYKPCTFYRRPLSDSRSKGVATF